MLSAAESEDIKLDDHYGKLIAHWEDKKAHVLNTIKTTIKESQLQAKPDLTVMGVVLRDVKRFCEQ